jgi:hypothetical protein
MRRFEGMMNLALENRPDAGDLIRQHPKRYSYLVFSKKLGSSFPFDDQSMRDV